LDSPKYTFSATTSAFLRLLPFWSVHSRICKLPDTTAIYFEGDRTQAINAAAQTLAKACAQNTFALSFLKSSNGFALPQGRTRLYLENVSAAQAAGMVEESGIENAEKRVVFLTDLMDTRFDEFSVMRPVKISE
jgi:hypothetical protein